MPQKRPVAVVVVAVFQLLFGVLALLDSASTLAGLDRTVAAAGQVSTSKKESVSVADVEKRLEQNVPGYGVIKQASVGLEGVLAVMMIASAIGLLRLRPWGRVLALVYAVLSIVSRLGYLAWFLATVPPVVSAFGKELAAAGGDLAELTGTWFPIAYVGLQVVMSLSVLYPIIVLIVLSRRRVRAVFTG